MLKKSIEDFSTILISSFLGYDTVRQKINLSCVKINNKGGFVLKTKMLIDLTDDICFKYIFSKEHILKDFLNSFFEFIGSEEKVIEVKSNTEVELFGHKYKHKIFYGDILAFTNTGSIVSIEMYNHFQEEELIKVYLT